MPSVLSGDDVTIASSNNALFQVVAYGVEVALPVKVYNPSFEEFKSSSKRRKFDSIRLVVIWSTKERTAKPALSARDTLRDSTTHEGDIVEEPFIEKSPSNSTLFNSSPLISHEVNIESVANIVKAIYILLITLLLFTLSDIVQTFRMPDHNHRRPNLPPVLYMSW